MKTGKKVFLITNILLTFFLLLYAVVAGIKFMYPLAVSLLLFIVYAMYTGKAIKEVLKAMQKGIKKSLVVVLVLMIVGMLTASWFLSGSIPYLVYLGIRMIQPKLFIVCSFLLCAAVSSIMGTSFGTVNTIGVVLIVIARGSGVSTAMTAGAIISGIFFGDRCSPMSSSLVLLSTVTKTDLYENSKMCFKTIAVPAVVSIGLYTLLSFMNPMGSSAGNMADSIKESFVLTPWLLVPILVILLLCLKKVPIKKTMLCSGITALILAAVVQKTTVSKMIDALIFGFSLPKGAPSAEIMHGGGFFSMAGTCMVVVLSCMITSILEETHSLDAFKGVGEEDGAVTCYLKSILAGAVATAIGCNQTVGIIMTAALREDAYEKFGAKQFARDLSIAGSIIPTMIPWSIAVYTPIQVLGCNGLSYYPFTFLLFALVIWGGIMAARTPRCS